MTTDEELTPADVLAMPLSEFVARFGFRPRDALEKKWFAVTAKRITPMEYQAVKAGVIGDYPLDDVVMDA